jgi:NTP pyrophosphatase (non-canonical NTP hydrolase)
MVTPFIFFLVFLFRLKKLFSCPVKTFFVFSREMPCKQADYGTPRSYYAAWEMFFRNRSGQFKMGVLPVSEDARTTLQDLKDAVAAFVEEREWTRFHTPKNLAMSVAIEAAELMELFQWTGGREIEPELMGRVEEELADVVIYCLAMANAAGIDLARAVRQKMEANAKKYPAGVYRGKFR